MDDVHKRPDESVEEFLARTIPLHDALRRENFAQRARNLAVKPPEKKPEAP